MDFARRAHDHSFHIDPIVRSLMDTDFYKLLMMQFIWEKYPNTHVGWAVKNRTTSIRLANEVDQLELISQLEHVRNLRFQPSELIWLRGQTFYGKEGIFKPGFIDYLRTFHLPEYTLTDGADGQIDLRFDGSWVENTLWEIYGLTILNELRYRGIMRTMDRSQLDIMYARAKVKLHDKLNALAKLDGLNLSDFGTRRRHSFLWQEYCVQTATAVLGKSFSGTSNAYLAMKHGLEARGTNAHELPMVLAALAGNDEELKTSQYRVLQQWQTMYHDGLKVFLPDTFGTTQFLKNAPEWIRYWTGVRIDSKNPQVAAEELIAFWKFHGEDPKTKLTLFSDGLDLESIEALHLAYADKTRVGFGWGTNLTNDFTDCHPDGRDIMKPVSLVCKVASAEGHPAVKLSDNYDKATGPAEEVDRYRRVFGIDGMANIPVLV